MTNSEMVERIVKKSGITREQAEDALEKNNNDLLDAMIYVERMYVSGRTDDSSHYSTYEAADNASTEQQYYADINCSKNAQEDSCFKKAVRSCIKTLLKNDIAVNHNGKEIFSLPLIFWAIAFVTSASTLFWVMIISMLFDVRYYVKGVTFNAEKVNGFMDNVYGFIKTIKSSFTA